MIVLGSLFDFQVSSALINQESVFGRLLCSYGQAPQAIVTTSVGAMLLFGRDREHSVRRTVDLVLGVVCVVLGVLISYYEPTIYLAGFGISMPAVVIPVSLAINAVTLVVVGRLAKDADHNMVVRLAITFAAVLLLDLAVVNIAKIPWARPRMRFLVTTPEATFQPWWRPGYELRDYFVASGVAAEEFKSFPSGHTCDATTVLLLSLLPYLRRDFTHQRQIFFAGVLWVVLVAVSRIIMGAHFVTDVSFGFLIGLVLFALGWRRVDRLEAQKNAAEKNAAEKDGAAPGVTA